MVLLHEEEPNGRGKEQRGVEAPYSSEPQKAHLTGEFVGVLQNCGCTMLCLVSRLANVVR